MPVQMRTPAVRKGTTPELIMRLTEEGFGLIYGMKIAGIEIESIFASEVSMLSRTLMAASTRPIILAILSRGEDYGYSLIQKVKEFSGGNIDWTEGMIYPVLQRMEIDELISSKWKLSADKRPRRYFRITECGRAELASELAGWGNVWKALNHFAKALRAEE
jgi:DNA-binding PadR family transcriptional regulator